MLTGYGRPAALGGYGELLSVRLLRIGTWKTQGRGRDIDYPPDWGREDRPVINVSWDHAKAYAAWLSPGSVCVATGGVRRRPGPSGNLLRGRIPTPHIGGVGDFDRGKAVCGGGDRTLPIGSGVAGKPPGPAGRAG